jgi:hypothetical protein
MMAMTTSSSISVNPPRDFRIEVSGVEGGDRTITPPEMLIAAREDDG